MIDAMTGRPFGDHGKGHDAIEYALEHIEDDAEKIEFLREWMHGSCEDWPLFYKWLKKEGR